MLRVIYVWTITLLLFGAVHASADPTSLRTILVLGDSLSAGYGIRVEEGWVALLQKRLEAQGYGYRVVNASITGETSSGGLARLPRALKIHQPAIVIIELGGNDGLRGLPLATTRQNLTSIVELSQQAGAEVALLGMRLPPNYGPRYTKSFHDMFGEIARSRDVPLVPFFLEDVAQRDGFMQPDGLHPTERAQPVMLEAVWPVLQSLLGRPR